jgi:phospholipase D1/2
MDTLEPDSSAEPVTAANEAPEAQSARFLIPGKTCWRVARARRAAVLIDAAAYFKALENALPKARRSIYIIGWDLNHVIPLHCGDCSGRAHPSLRQYLRRLARKNRQLEIRVLKWWSPIAFEIKRRTIPFPLLNWLSGRRVQFKLDNDHPPTASLHQKFVVIDDALAFCGGLDVTDCRWDTPEHLDEDKRRRSPKRDIYPPFHDLMMAVDGDAAAVLGDLARERWHRATHEYVSASATPGTDIWPDRLSPDFEDIDIGVARTEAEWNGRREVREAEALNVAAIRAARRTIYIENQHFASRAVYAVLREQLARPDGPEVVVLGPERCPGTIEEAVMGPARAKIVNRLRALDRFNRFRAYIPKTAGGNAIVVHSKCLIIDDRMLRIGSSNMNNRSMGFDNECDLALEAGEDETEIRRRIATIRTELLGEHLGVLHKEVQAKLDETGSLIQTIEALRRPFGRTLLPLEVPPDADPEQEPTDSLLDPEHPSTIVPGMKPPRRLLLGRARQRRPPLRVT